MKKQGYADTTLKTTGKRLRNIARHANIENPEQVKTFIASKECTNGFKEGLAKAYDLYVKLRELNWNKPFIWKIWQTAEDSQRTTDWDADCQRQQEICLDFVDDEGDGD